MTHDQASTEVPALCSFSFDGVSVRVILRDGEPWWVASDVAAILGLGRTHDAVRSLDEDEKGAEKIRTLGGPQLLTVVNEPGLYSLVLRSNKPNAKRFRRWLTHDVLPQLRQAGYYAVPSAVPRALPSTYAEALRALADEVEARANAEKRVQEMAPAASSWTELAKSKGNYSLRQVAFILNQCPEIETGQNRLMKTLIELRMVGKDGQPYARHAQHVQLRPRNYIHPKSGERRLAKPQVRLTLRGVQYLHRRLGGTGRLEVGEPWD